MHKNKFWKKGFVIGIIILLSFASLPLVSGNGNISFRQKILPSEEITSPKPGLTHDNLKITLMGTYPFDTLMILLGYPIYFFELMVWNQNDIPITLNMYTTLIGTKENRVLDEFDASLPFKLKPDYGDTLFLYTQNAWEYFDYTFGLFKFIVEIQVPELGTDISIEFQGFVWTKIGCFVFNPGGKLIEE